MDDDLTISIMVFIFFHSKHQKGLQIKKLLMNEYKFIFFHIRERAFKVRCQGLGQFGQSVFTQANLAEGPILYKYNSIIRKQCDTRVSVFHPNLVYNRKNGVPVWHDYNRK